MKKSSRKLPDYISNKITYPTYTFENVLVVMIFFFYAFYKYAYGAKKLLIKG